MFWQQTQNLQKIYGKGPANKYFQLFLTQLLDFHAYSHHNIMEQIHLVIFSSIIHEPLR